MGSGGEAHTAGSSKVPKREKEQNGTSSRVHSPVFHPEVMPPGMNLVV